MLCEVLRFIESHEDWILEVKLARLGEQLQVGADQLNHGEGISVESKGALNTFFNDIKV